MGAAFHPHSNSITPLRLVLASLVVFSHAYVTGGFGHDPLYQATGGQMQLGTVAVIAFFALSGFLLTGSKMTSRRATFARNRALRIVPAFWVCLVVIVLVVAPLAALMGGSAPASDITAWAIRAATFNPFPSTVVGFYGATGQPDLVDAPLWSLPIEVVCYIILLLLPRRSLAPAILGILFLAVLVNVAGNGAPVFQLLVAFMSGACIWIWRDRVPATAVIAVALLVLTGLSVPFGMLAFVAPLTLAYVAIWASTVIRVTWRHDLSYGVYIYGWPIQQLLAMAGLAAFGIGPYLLICIAPIALVAFASARLIEEPALRLRHRTSSRHLVRSAGSNPV